MQGGVASTYVWYIPLYRGVGQERCFVNDILNKQQYAWEFRHHLIEDIQQAPTDADLNHGGSEGSAGPSEGSDFSQIWTNI